MRRLLFILLLIVSTTLKSQDIFFTQKFNVNTYLNPALVGNMDKPNRLSFIYRDQWRSVPVPFVSSFIGYDRKFWNSKNNLISGGVNLYFDKVGDGNLSTYIPNLQFSYTRFVNEEKQAFSWGTEIGYNIRTIGSGGLSFDDPSIVENIASSASALRLGFGFNFKTKMGKKSYWNFGTSLYNPHQPNMSFTGLSEDKRPIRYLVSVGSELFFNDKVSFSPFFSFQRQEKVNEFQTVGVFNYYTAFSKTDMKVSLGAGYRVNDAPIVYGGVKVKDFLVGVSYDINTSLFSVATARRGAGEVSLTYEFGKKKGKDTLLLEIESEEIKEVIEEDTLEEKVVQEEIVVVENPTTEDGKDSLLVNKADSLEGVDKLIPVLDWKQKIEALPVMNLFFFNDEPNPRSLMSSTNTSYGESYDSYISKKDMFAESIGAEETEKLFELIRNSYKELSVILEAVQLASESGIAIKIELIGYASPLASSSYNLSLTSRRIESIKTYIENYNNGALKEYVQSGKIHFETTPLGKTKAPEYVSSSTTNKKLSVFSPLASFERRVEVKITFAK